MVPYEKSDVIEIDLFTSDNEIQDVETSEIQEKLNEIEKKNLENGIDELLENAPQMYAKVMAELQYLKENGADEKQMASLQRKADLLKVFNLTTKWIAIHKKGCLVNQLSEG